MPLIRRVDLITPDGVPLVARYWPADSPLAYVVAHGFTGHSGMERTLRICSRLADRGAAVLAADFRGHGDSGGACTLGELEVRDLAACVAFLRAEGYPTIATAGWSMGGSVVLRHAGLGGDSDAVVSISSPGHWYERGTAPMQLVHWAAETMTGRLMCRLVRRTRMAIGWHDIPESPVEVVDRIAPTPLLVIHGDSDAYFPVEHGAALAAAAPAAAYWLEPGMGHAETATTDELVDRIDEWVRVQVGQPRDAVVLEP